MIEGMCISFFCISAAGLNISRLNSNLLFLPFTAEFLGPIFQFIPGQLFRKTVSHRHAVVKGVAGSGGFSVQSSRRGQ